MTILSSFHTIQVCLLFPACLDMKRFSLLVSLSVFWCLFASNLAWAEKQTVAYINSYHKEYPWSESIFNAFKDELPSSVKVVEFHMDSKRIKSPKALKSKAAAIAKQLQTIKPNVIAAVDDNASKYIIQPYYRDAKTPVVFAGINIGPEAYGYPYKNVTGIIEADDTGKYVKLQSLYYKNRELVFIFTNTTTGKRKLTAHNKKYGTKYTTYLAKTLSSLNGFIKTFDVKQTFFVLDNLAGIEGFSPDAMKRLVKNKKGAIFASISDSNVAFSHLIYENNAIEQGREMALMAKKILAGRSTYDLPIKYSELFDFTINIKLFKQTHSPLEPTLLLVPHTRIR